MCGAIEEDLPKPRESEKVIDGVSSRWLKTSSSASALLVPKVSRLDGDGTETLEER